MQLFETQMHVGKIVSNFKAGYLLYIDLTKICLCRAIKRDYFAGLVVFYNKDVCQ